MVELGAGTGKNTRWLASRAKSLLALDFCEEMLTIARQRTDMSGARFVRHDIRTSWPVATASIDVVLANLVLEHVDDLRPVFELAFNALRPGGVLYVSELHPFRQLRGSQARFDQDGESLRIRAHYHSISEYLRVGRDEGFNLRTLEEHADPDDSHSVAQPPRLLVMVFDKPEL